MRESADVIIDTSSRNIHQLATEVAELFSDEGAPRHTLTIMSFGFKYGLPPDADLVADMRFLPNPFWNEELRALTGEDDAVRDYVLEQDGRAGVHRRVRAPRSHPVLEGYQRENKRNSVVADRLHRRQASLRRDGGRARRAAGGGARGRGPGEASGPRARDERGAASRLDPRSATPPRGDPCR